MSINVKNVYFSYRKGKQNIQILNNINLSINKSEFIGIVGNVGCGKTTLIKHLNGLLIPEKGTVTIDGLNSSKKTICKKVGILFQQPSKQLFCKTIFEDIAYGPSNFGIKKKALDQCVNNAIISVGLNPVILNKSPFNLSGGEMRLIALAGILSSPSSDYLILDEANSGLSDYYKTKLFSILDNLKKKGLGIVLVSHNIDDIIDIVDRIVYMEDGKIIFNGTPDDYIQSIMSPVPEITILMRELKKSGLNVRDNIYSIDKAFDEIVSTLKSNKGENK